MAVFNDLAIELQEAIWELLLPSARGVHWIEVEGTPQDPDFIRDSIRMTKWYKFDRMPETFSEVTDNRWLNPEFNRRANATQKESSPFFSNLITTVPAVFGQTGPESNESGELRDNLADEIANTSRCRHLSTYYQIATLHSLCRLSRCIAQRYIQDNCNHSWAIWRSMGRLYRPRPMDVWEVQYSGDKNPVVLEGYERQLLQAQIHTLDLVVFRLHDSKGEATSLLKHAPWQYWIEQQGGHGTTFACFDRIGLEWHPSWGTVGGRGNMRPGNIQAFVRIMQAEHFPATLYWLVDGVPRPDWDRDYPVVVQKIFGDRIADDKSGITKHLNIHWSLGPRDDEVLLSDHHLNQEFEANGRRYYIVFVVFGQFYEEEKHQLDEAGLGWSGPFPGNAAMWPKALREPVRLAYDVCRDGYKNLGTYKGFSYILSWEPIG